MPNAYLDAQGGVGGGGVPHQKMEILKFEIGIVQFDEYF